MLRVDYEALAAGSKTLLDQGDIFEQCIDTMKQVIEGLPDVWEADTSDNMFSSSWKQSRGSGKYGR